MKNEAREFIKSNPEMYSYVYLVYVKTKPNYYVAYSFYDFKQFFISLLWKQNHIKLFHGAKKYRTQKTTPDKFKWRKWVIERVLTVFCDLKHLKIYMNDKATVKKKCVISWEKWA